MSSIIQIKEAILVQGKFNAKYTTQSIEQYLKKTDYLICLSCWVDDREQVELHLQRFLQDPRLQIVYNVEPEFTGYQNINLQVISAKAGIEKLRDIGCERILKTRSDFRIENPDIFFKKVKEVGKLTVLLTNNPNLDLYFCSDFFVAGSALDMELFYSPPPCRANDNRSVGNQNLQKALENRDIYLELGSSRIAERYLLANYLKLKGVYLPQSILEKVISWPLHRDEYFSFLNVELANVDSLKKYHSLEQARSYVDIRKEDKILLNFIWLFFRYVKLELSLYLKSKVGNLVK